MDRFLPIVDNEWYHVYNRGNDRRTLFHTSADYAAFAEKLVQGLARYRVSRIASVLMPNHFHLVLLQHPGGELPHLMNSIETSFAKRFNLLHHHKGHVFGSRYRCAHVPTEESLIDLVCYVHMNPVRAGLVRHPKDWKHSDFSEVMKDGIQARDPGRANGYFLVSSEAYKTQVEEAITNLRSVRLSSKHRQGGPSSGLTLRGRVP